MTIFASDCIDLIFSRIGQKNSSSRSSRLSGENSSLQSPQPSRRSLRQDESGRRPQAGAFSPPLKHPTFVKKQYGNSP
jgi:hypothetical protein